MGSDFTILAGSVSQGIWRSADGGQSWRNFHGKKMPVWEPFTLEAQVRGLAVDPTNPAVVYAGDELGVCKSTDRGDNWERLHGPMDGMTIWSVVVDPTNPNNVFAGSRPPALFRSKTAGKTWEKLKVELPQECEIGVPRVLVMRIDPLNPKNIYAAVEVAGVWRSLDGGDTWERLRGGFGQDHMHEDIHDITLVPGMRLKKNNGRARLEPGRGETLLITMPGRMEASDDMGESFSTVIEGKDFRLHYLRAVAVRPDDPRVIYVGKSDTAIGGDGDMVRTKDGGATWEVLKLPVKPNSGVFGIAVHPSNPKRLVATTLFGQIYLSEDGGDTWVKSERETNELRAVKWVPNS